MVNVRSLSSLQELLLPELLTPPRGRNCCFAFDPIDRFKIFHSWSGRQRRFLLSSLSHFLAVRCEIDMVHDRKCGASLSGSLNRLLFYGDHREDHLYGITGESMETSLVCAHSGGTSS